MEPEGAEADALTSPDIGWPRVPDHPSLEADAAPAGGLLEYPGVGLPRIHEGRDADGIHLVPQPRHLELALLGLRPVGDHRHLPAGRPEPAQRVPRVDGELEGPRVLPVIRVDQVLDRVVHCEAGPDAGEQLVAWPQSVVVRHHQPGAGIVGQPVRVAEGACPPFERRLAVEEGVVEIEQGDRHDRVLAPTRPVRHEGRIFSAGPVDRNLCSMASETGSGSPTRGSQSSRSTDPTTSAAGTPRPNSARPVATPIPGASARTCTGDVCGPCASTPDSGRPRPPTNGSSSSSTPVRPGCPAPSTCPPRWATTPTTPGRRARSAR